MSTVVKHTSSNTSECVSNDMYNVSKENTIEIESHEQQLLLRNAEQHSVHEKIRQIQPLLQPLSPPSSRYLLHPVDGSIMVDATGRPITQSRVLATKPLQGELLERPGPGGRKLTYMSGESVTRLLNEIFGYDGWNLDVKSTEKIEAQHDAKTGKYQVSYMAHVRITLVNHNNHSSHHPNATIIAAVPGAYREDIGFGDSIDRQLCTATQHSVKSAVTDAVKRAARHFGDRLGNSLYEGSFSSRKAPRKLSDALLDHDRRVAERYDWLNVNPNIGTPSGTVSNVSVSSSSLSAGQQQRSHHHSMDNNHNSTTSMMKPPPSLQQPPRHSVATHSSTSVSILPVTNPNNDNNIPAQPPQRVPSSNVPHNDAHHHHHHHNNHNNNKQNSYSIVGSSTTATAAAAFSDRTNSQSTSNQVILSSATIATSSHNTLACLDLAIPLSASAIHITTPLATKSSMMMTTDPLNHATAMPPSVIHPGMAAPTPMPWRNASHGSDLVLPLLNRPITASGRSDPIHNHNHNNNTITTSSSATCDKGPIPIPIVTPCAHFSTVGSGTTLIPPPSASSLSTQHCVSMMYPMKRPRSMFDEASVSSSSSSSLSPSENGGAVSVSTLQQRLSLQQGGVGIQAAVPTSTNLAAGKKKVNPYHIAQA